MKITAIEAILTVVLAAYPTTVAAFPPPSLGNVAARAPADDALPKAIPENADPTLQWWHPDYWDRSVHKDARAPEQIEAV
ncbi:hypothetical protein GQ53DRAFT_825743 [Thozetella sp. PMI_491]|nr:hypothetical protein GQ53DRAFT_825743 [Thozetella sp. PMI_491]